MASPVFFVEDRDVFNLVGFKARHDLNINFSCESISRCETPCPEVFVQTWIYTSGIYNAYLSSFSFSPGYPVVSHRMCNNDFITNWIYFDATRSCRAQIRCFYVTCCYTGRKSAHAAPRFNNINIAYDSSHYFTYATKSFSFTVSRKDGRNSNLEIRNVGIKLLRQREVLYTYVNAILIFFFL